MTKQLTTMQIGEPVSKVRRLFEQGQIHHVPIMDGDKLVGIVSWSDMLRVSFGELGNQDGRELDAILDHTYSLAEVMNKEPAVISSHSTVRDAARMLGQGTFHSLPVIDNDKLVGLVTTTDLLNYLVEQ